MTVKIGEVIEAQTAGYTAQSYELFNCPSLGSLVKTKDGDLELYGIVHSAQTEGIDPSRKPIARGKDAESEESMYQDNPHLKKLLRSDFSVIIIGHKDADGLKHYLPPHPARIHSFVSLCSEAEIKEFSSSFGFLHILTQASLNVPLEEIIGASLRHMGKAHEDSRAFLVRAGKELASILSSDINRLKAILERIKQ